MRLCTATHPTALIFSGLARRNSSPGQPGEGLLKAAPSEDFRNSRQKAGRPGPKGGAKGLKGAAQHDHAPSAYVNTPSSPKMTLSSCVDTPSSYKTKPSSCVVAQASYEMPPSSYVVAPPSYEMTPSSCVVTPSSYEMMPSSCVVTHSSYERTPSSVVVTSASYEMKPSSGVVTPSPYEVVPGAWMTEMPSRSLPSFACTVLVRRAKELPAGRQAARPNRMIRLGRVSL